MDDASPLPSAWTCMTPNYPGYGSYHLVRVMSFGATVCTAVFGLWRDSLIRPIPYMEENNFWEILILSCLSCCPSLHHIYIHSLDYTAQNFHGKKMVLLLNKTKENLYSNICLHIMQIKLCPTRGLCSPTVPSISVTASDPYQLH